MTVEKSKKTGLAVVLRVHSRLAVLFSAGPGILVSVTIGLAAAFLSEHYGGPVMLYALLLGMAFHFLAEEGPCVAGIQIAARNILRIGVALLGVRITVEQILSLGLGPVVTMVVAVTLTIAVGWLIARNLHLSRNQGLLSGGAVAICGASAALAIAAVLPKHNDSERDTILTVVGVTTLSTIAMVLYPMLVGALELNHVAAGIFLGGTIHDVAQVVGAGYMISPQAGDVSPFIKLLRVAMLVPVVLCFSLFFRQAHNHTHAEKTPILPGFLIVFVLLVGMNSAGLFPASVVSSLSDLSRWCLVTAIAALGIKTSFKKLAVVGWRPIALMVGETLFLAAVVLGSLLIGLGL